MKRRFRRSAFATLIVLGAGCGAAGALSFGPVREGRVGHLGITVDAPGTQNWFVTEKRFVAGWRVIYKNEDAANLASTRLIVLKADRYEAGGFARAHGSLRDLADKVLAETRQGSTDPRFKERWAEIVRADLGGIEAYRVRIAWEERNNRTLPGKELLLQNLQVLTLHPKNPDEILSIMLSTRHEMGKEELKPEDLATSFLGSLRFE